MLLSLILASSLLTITLTLAAALLTLLISLASLLAHLVALGYGLWLTITILVARILVAAVAVAASAVLIIKAGDAILLGAEGRLLDNLFVALQCD